MLRGNVILQGIRPSVSALLRSAAAQQPLLAGSAAMNQRELKTLGSSGSVLTPAQKMRMMQMVKASTAAGEAVHKHAFHFKFERYWAAGMLPLLPAAYFIHGPVMDYALAIALTMHIHWGLFAVVQDYARPFVVGETVAKLGAMAIYIVTALMFAGLIHFNYHDVGLTKAFEMVWAL